MENPKNHYVGNVAQKAIIEKDSSILVVRGIGDRVWGFPGGRLHAEETPYPGLVREVKEELGIDIKVLLPISVIRSYHRKSATWQVFVAYFCKIVGDTSVTIDPVEIEEVKWITKEELKIIPMFDDCREVANVYLNHV